MQAYSGESDHVLVLHCLPMSHKMDTMLIWVNKFFKKFFRLKWLKAQSTVDLELTRAQNLLKIN